jgi:hypothetical protein
VTAGGSFIYLCRYGLRSLPKLRELAGRRSVEDASSGRNKR